jgi:hypothetical protein
MDCTELRNHNCAISDADASGRALSRIAGSNHVRGMYDRVL